MDLKLQVEKNQVILLDKLHQEVELKFLSLVLDVRSTKENWIIWQEDLVELT
jgi:hypothetical protein